MTRLTRSITRFGTRKPVELACQPASSQRSVAAVGVAVGAARVECRSSLIEPQPRASTGEVTPSVEAAARSLSLSLSLSLYSSLSTRGVLRSIVRACMRACGERRPASRREHTNQFRRQPQRRGLCVALSDRDRTLGTPIVRGIENRGVAENYIPHGSRENPVKARAR